ncbi:hypothetical protein [Paucilactobacillus sp. N302-9]
MKVNTTFYKYVSDNTDMSFSELADKLKRENAKTPYSITTFNRLSHGLHTWNRYDDFVFWLIDHKLQKLIKWEE